MVTNTPSPISRKLGRRAFFRLGAGAALTGLGAAGAAAVVLAPTVARAATNVDFDVVIDGLSVAPGGVASFALDPLTMKKPKTKPKKAVVGNLRLDFVPPDPILEADLRSWVDGAAAGTCDRRTVQIHVRDAQSSQPVRSINCFDCFPMSWSFDAADLRGGGETLRWTLEVRVDRINLA